MTVFIPAQCSEREPGGWEDCTWATGVDLQNAAHANNVVPTTRDEYQALRVAGGEGPAENPGDGSNFAQLVDGMRRRYGWSPRRIGPPGAVKAPWSAVANGLAKVGDCAGVQGLMGVWLSTSRWRRWDPPFDGAHAMFVERVDLTDRVWLLNPLAPNSYAGEFLPMLELRRFYDSFTGGAVFAHVGQEAPIQHRIHLIKGAVVRVYDTTVVRGQRVITGYRDVPWNHQASAADANDRVHLDTDDGKSGAYAALVTSGITYGGRWVQVQRPAAVSIRGLRWS